MMWDKAVNALQNFNYAHLDTVPDPFFLPTLHYFAKTTMKYSLLLFHCINNVVHFV